MWITVDKNMQKSRISIKRYGSSASPQWIRRREYSSFPE
jgi:hypothetical protein